MCRFYAFLVLLARRFCRFSHNCAYLKGNTVIYKNVNYDFVTPLRSEPEAFAQIRGGRARGRVEGGRSERDFDKPSASA